MKIFYWESLQKGFIELRGRLFPTKWRNMVCLRCETDNSGQWTHDGRNDCLDFITHLDCIMLGINVFGSTTYSGKHDISLTILKSSDVLRSMKTVLCSERGQLCLISIFSWKRILDAQYNWAWKDLQLFLETHITIL